MPGRAGGVGYWRPVCVTLALVAVRAITMENMAVQAAIDGHGVALVGDMRVVDDLAVGPLVRPFDPNLSTPLTFSYYLLSAKDNAGRPKVEARLRCCCESV